MSNNVVNINRNDLAKLTPDLRIIRAFEQIFNVVPENFNENNLEANNATTKAIQAVGTSTKNERILKGAKVLLWLSI